MTMWSLPHHISTFLAYIMPLVRWMVAIVPCIMPAVKCNWTFYVFCICMSWEVWDLGTDNSLLRLTKAYLFLAFLLRSSVVSFLVSLVSDTGVIDLSDIKLIFWGGRVHQSSLLLGPSSVAMCCTTAWAWPPHQIVIKKFRFCSILIIIDSFGTQLC